MPRTNTHKTQAARIYNLAADAIDAWTEGDFDVSVGQLAATLALVTATERVAAAIESIADVAGTIASEMYNGRG